MILITGTPYVIFFQMVQVDMMFRCLWILPINKIMQPIRYLIVWKKIKIYLHFV